MLSKKFKILTTLCMLLSLGAAAQTTGSYDVYDSSVISGKNMPQQNEFWNNTYSFPAKPRNMLEVGISVGVPTISGDVATKVPAFGAAVHLRKAFGYVFSLRLQYLYANAKGQNWIGSENFAKNPAWNRYGSVQRNNNGLVENRFGQGGALAPRSEIVYYNYKTNIQDLGIQGIFTLNNLRFHKSKTGMVVYAGAGIGGSIYETKVNALDASGNPYTALFATTAANSANGLYKNRKDTRKALKAGMDDTYESLADRQGTRRPLIGGKTFKPSGTVLAGIAFRLGKRINLALEDRFTLVKDDLLDGQRWQEQARGDAVLTRDFDSYNYLSLGLNFNLGAKSVEPLWWLNPLDYAYNELNNPKHMLLPKPVLDDSDGDGVIDQLDREPNTPAGCPVDTHGVTKDTDGDGVPDCKDKQLITPTECQPVDAAGVGKCPEPDCCSKIKDVVTTTCPTDYPSLSFSGSTLSNDARAQLATIASRMKANPNCNIIVVGYPEASKSSQAACRARLEAVQNYLVTSQGISAGRITTDCQVGGGDKNTVDVRSN